MLFNLSVNLISSVISSFTALSSPILALTTEILTITESTLVSTTVEVISYEIHKINCRLEIKLYLKRLRIYDSAEKSKIWRLVVKIQEAYQSTMKYYRTNEHIKLSRRLSVTLTSKYIDNLFHIILYYENIILKCVPNSCNAQISPKPFDRLDSNFVHLFFGKQQQRGVTTTLLKEWPKVVS